MIPEAISLAACRVGRPCSVPPAPIRHEVGRLVRELPSAAPIMQDILIIYDELIYTFTGKLLFIASV
jgi:hypothetical protein